MGLSLDAGLITGTAWLQMGSKWPVAGHLSARTMQSTSFEPWTLIPEGGSHLSPYSRTQIDHKSIVAMDHKHSSGANSSVANNQAQQAPDAKIGGAQQATYAHNPARSTTNAGYSQKLYNQTFSLTKIRQLQKMLDLQDATNSSAWKTWQF